MDSKSGYNFIVNLPLWISLKFPVEIGSCSGHSCRIFVQDVSAFSLVPFHFLVKICSFDVLICAISKQYIFSAIDSSITVICINCTKSANVPSLAF